MKNKILILVWTILLTTGCKKDFLVQEPLASFTDENFWTSESSVRAFAMGYYADRFPGFGNNDVGGSFSIHETLNDDYTNISLPGFASVVTNNGGSWNSYFTMIRKDNIFVDRVSKMQFNDTIASKHWIGIARFFRALDYSNFVFDFGDVPYFNTPLADNDTLLFKPRDPATFVMDNVLNDFIYASQNVKLTDPLTGPNGLVITKDVVNAFMSRQMLYIGTKLKYDPNTSTADRIKAGVYLQAAKDAAGRVISSGRYSVADNYQKLCSTIDIGATPAVKKEMILFREYNTGEVTHAIASGNNVNTVQGYAAPKDVIDAYLCTNGLPIKTTAGGVNPLYLGDQTCANQMTNRDPRLANTFLTDRFYLQYIETGYATTGYKCYKFLDIATQDQNYAIGSSNITDAPIIRLGEVMMNYIEAAAELADMGLYSVTQSDVDQTINALRKRAGYLAATRLPDMKIVGGLPAIGSTVYDDADRDPSVPSFIWEVRRERRLELLYEGFRFHDILRWRKIAYENTELYPKKNLGAWITKSSVTKALILANISGTVTSAGNVTTGSGYLKVSQTVRNATNGYVLDRDYLQSVPTYQIDFYQRNGSVLTQNPGW